MIPTFHPLIYNDYSFSLTIIKNLIALLLSCTVEGFHYNIVKIHDRLTPTTAITIIQYRLEEKQRAKRKKREAAASKAAKAAAAGNHEEAQGLEKEATYSPVWFKKEYDPLTNSMIHVYQGGYWEAKQKKNWDELNLPDLF